MNNGKYIRWMVYGAALALCVICYIAAYIHAYDSEPETEVRYYKCGEKVVYGGVGYTFDSEKYTADELSDKFSLDSNRVKKIDKDISGIYIVTKVHAVRIMECEEADKVRDNTVILNKYMDGSGRYDEILDMIQLKDYVHENELKQGEQTEYYMLNVISKNSYCEEVWKHMDDAAFYVEFPEYESREYITRVKIIDGNYGVF